MTEYVPGALCYDEITNQDQAWAQVIDAVLSRAGPIQRIFKDVDEVLFVGCGSALNVSFTGASIFQTQTNITARAVPAAEVYFFPGSLLRNNRKTLAIILSRSGKTTEVLQALDALRHHNVPVFGITCQDNSPLAQKCDLGLVLSPLVEQAVPTTRSVTGMIIALQLLGAIISENTGFIHEIQRLPEICALQMPIFLALGKEIGCRTDLTNYAFVGNGPFYGQSRESQLKIKEMTLQPADAYPLFDYRHGPQSTVGEHMLVTAMFSNSAFPQEVQFLHDMKALGGVTFALCDRSDRGLRSAADHILELETGLSDLARGPLYMPAIQFMAYFRALSLGLNPDEPHNLSYWINLSSP
jgi:glucosamine--fructose-6-phosphate aminotransferase (isomerizing)